MNELSHDTSTLSHLPISSIPLSIHSAQVSLGRCVPMESMAQYGLAATLRMLRSVAALAQDKAA